MRQTLRLIRRTAGDPKWDRPPEMSPALWRILGARGCRSREDARAFLNPSKADIIDPFALSGMDEAVDIIREHMRSGRKICVWGDYDVDGVSATAILLKAFKRLGVDAFHHIPSRFGEGYGFNEKGVLSLDCDLLISVDCGISERDIIEKAHMRRMSVIVTDHHEIPAKLPDCPVVNPLLGDYPNRNLCGAGVAFKLALALCPDCFDLIDIAALATVADVVPLRGENRAIVKLGLERMNAVTRPGIRALVEAAGIADEITAQKVAFQLSPRLNAGGRMKSAEKALTLLLSDDPDECARVASELNGFNTERRGAQARVFNECEMALADEDMSRARSIILAGEDWPAGVVGLAASKLAEKYNMPSVLLSRDGDMMTGSCRSIAGCDIHACLTAVSGLLEKFGGHSQAAGLTIEARNFDAFKRALGLVIAETTPEDAFIPRVEYDGELSLGEITTEFISSLDALEPTGFGNPSPAFLSELSLENARRMGKNAAHASFTAIDETGSVRGVWFGGGERIEGVRRSNVRAVYSASVNEFRGERNAQIQIKEMLLPGKSAFFISGDEEDMLVNSFITHRLYNTPIAQNCAAIDIDDLRWALKKPRGTLVIACEAKTAARLAAKPELADADAFVGEFPKDPRAFNALCLLPKGEVPQGYERVVAVGAPDWLISQNAVCLEEYPAARWLDQLPGVGELREIYIACREICKSPGSFSSEIYLSREIAKMSDATIVQAQAGIMILRDMGLVEYSIDPVRLSICPVRKTDPEKNAAFNAVAELKRWGGARQ